MSRVRRVHYKEFGDFFVGLRESRGWNQSDAARYAKQRGLRALSRQVLLRLERGQTKNPEPAVMREIANLYGLSYGDLVNRFVTMRYGTDVTTPVTGTDQGSAAPGGPPDAYVVVANHSVSELVEARREIETLKARLAAVEDVAGHLARIAAGDEDAAIGKRKARPRRGHRKTG